ncbi:MAG: PH domain-containing protein [Oscillospiraceae bacterium]|nr:PH domain-containing protein [Oscillospiraceae bacterium]
MAVSAVNKCSEKLVALYRIYFSLLFIPAVIFGVILLLLFRIAGLILLVIGISAIVLLIYLYAPALFESTSYARYKGWMRIERGVLFKCSTVIPRRQIQYLLLSANPFERKLGLCTLTFCTPGGRVRLSGITPEEANSIRKVFDRRVAI